jgi:hypothetical protein
MVLRFPEQMRPFVDRPAENDRTSMSLDVGSGIPEASQRGCRRRDVAPDRDRRVAKFGDTSIA